jgi:hypothetical protein
MLVSVWNVRVIEGMGEVWRSYRRALTLYIETVPTRLVTTAHVS